MAELVPLQRVRGAPVIVCFPYAGAFQWIFRPWAEDLADIEVWTLELDEDESGGVRGGSLPDISAAVVDSVLDLIDRGVTLFGHSMGAAVAYEVCRMLQCRGEPGPGLLVVSACVAPQHWTTASPAEVEGDLTRARLKERLHEWGGTPPEVLDNEELLDAVLPRLRSDLRRCQQYRPVLSELDVPLLALAGTRDSDAPAPLVSGWSAATSRWLGLRTWPGGHFFINEHRDEVLALLRHHAGHDGVVDDRGDR